MYKMEVEALEVGPVCVGVGCVCGCTFMYVHMSIFIH